MSVGRLKCVVPFCRRTTSAVRFAGDSEWICGPHWRHVAKATRQRLTAAKRYARKTADRRFVGRAWERAKAEAITAGAPS